MLAQFRVIEGRDSSLVRTVMVSVVVVRAVSTESEDMVMIEEKTDARQQRIFDAS